MKNFINENIVKNNNLDSLFWVKSLDNLNIKIKDYLFVIIDSFLKDKTSFQLNYLNNHSVILNIGKSNYSDEYMFDCQIIQVFQKAKNIADL